MTLDQMKVMFQNHSLLPWRSVYQNVRIAIEMFASMRSRAA